MHRFSPDGPSRPGSALVAVAWRLSWASLGPTASVAAGAVLFLIVGRHPGLAAREPTVRAAAVPEPQLTPVAAPATHSPTARRRRHARCPRRTPPRGAGRGAWRDGRRSQPIEGIGPKLEELCHSLGFFHFDQIANWTAPRVAWVDENLTGFKGRVTRDKWVAQARLILDGRARTSSCAAPRRTITDDGAPPRPGSPAGPAGAPGRASCWPATMVLWMAAQWLGGQLGWEARYVFLFDLAALAAFLWALVVTYRIWRATPEHRKTYDAEGSGPDLHQPLRDA